MAGITVYLDTNNNRALDAGEPSTLTGADGSYVFAGLRTGDYVVREVVPTNFRQTTPGTTPDCLFSANSITFPNQIIEIDPLTGAVRNTFAAPTAAGTTGNAGLDFDGTTLYYLSDSNDVLYRLNPNNGAVLGQTALPAGTYDGLASLRGLVYAIETNNDRILVIDP